MTRRVQDALRRAEEHDFELYKAELRRRDRGDAPDADEDFSTELGQFLRSDAGYPLGAGYPPGGSLREDGQSHRDAWAAHVRLDPCAYCGRRPAGTLDHIEAQSTARPGEGHTWLNYTGACANCNGAKADMPLMEFLWMRAGRLSRRRMRETLREAALERAA